MHTTADYIDRHGADYPARFATDPEIVRDAMDALISELDQWREELEAEAGSDAVATVERAAEAVRDRAAGEMFR